MQKNINNKIKLGILVTVGLALFIVGIYFIGRKQHLFSNTFQISGVFKDISGLEIGNNVRFAGINIGVIDNIEMIADTAVRVDLMIVNKAKKFIKKDSRATIGSDGLMGSKLVLLLPGTSATKQIENNDFIATTIPASLDDIMEKLKTSLVNISQVTDDFTAIMSNMRAGKGAMGKLFMDPTLAKNLDQSIVNIKEGAGGFKQNMDAVGNNFLLRGYINKQKRKKQKAIDLIKEQQKEKAVEKEKELQRKKDLQKKN